MNKENGHNYRFFQHKDCEFFPCHQVEHDQIANFNCLFCYCPLYALGERCGGNFYISEKGVKVCTNCTFPHKRENYDQVMNKLKVFIQELSEKNLK